MLKRDAGPKVPPCSACGGPGINEFTQGNRLCDECCRAWFRESPTCDELERAHVKAHPEDIETERPSLRPDIALLKKGVAGRLAEASALSWLAARKKSQRRSA